MERDLRIQAEVIYRIKHTLLAAPDVKLTDLTRIRSTLQAATQHREGSPWNWNF